MAKQNNSSRALLLFLVLFLKHHKGCSQLCDSVMPSTWNGFVHALDNSHGFANLCPFEIRGDGCPRENYGYNVTGTALFILCNQFSPFGVSDQLSGCFLNCPGTFFTVSSASLLTLDGITLRGATRSAIRVESFGNLTTTNSMFENNSNQYGNGGVISADPDSTVEIENCQFQNNRALNGGALYLQGVAVIQSSQFLKNAATAGQGGAVSSGPEARIDLIKSSFNSNTATTVGPAVFDDSMNNNADRSQNTGCNNKTPNGAHACDGVQLARNSIASCLAFENGCTTTINASSPSIPMPSDTPSFKPKTTDISKLPAQIYSTRPTLKEMKRPTTTLSRRPSFEPSHVPTPSPSVSKGLMLSDLPSLSPSMLSTLRQNSMEPSHSTSSDFPSLPPPATVPSEDSTLPPSESGKSAPIRRPTTSLGGNTTSSPSHFPGIRSSDFPSVMPTGVPSLILLLQNGVRPPSSPPDFSPFPSFSTLSWQPTFEPSNQPSLVLSDHPSIQPTYRPSFLPTDHTSIHPMEQATDLPSILSLDQQPFEQWSHRPTILPTSPPSIRNYVSDNWSFPPSDLPSFQPSGQPTHIIPSA